MTLIPWAALVGALAAIVVSIAGIYASRQVNEASAISGLTSSVRDLNAELTDTRAKMKAAEESCKNQIAELKAESEERNRLHRAELLDLHQQIYQLKKDNGYG